MLRCGIKYPLDIYEVCSHFSGLEIAACPFITPGLRGMAVLADDESAQNCILVNSNLSHQEQNFHGTHELIHIYLNDGKNGLTFKCYDKVKPFQNHYTEWLANEGAAELILPHDVLLPYIKEKSKDFDNDPFAVYNMTDEISQNYNVSPVVVQNRLSSLKYEIYQYLSGCSLNNIEIISNNQQNRLGISVDLLNDVENRRINDLLYNKNPNIKPFFAYSETYSKLLVV